MPLQFRKSVFTNAAIDFGLVVASYAIALPFEGPQSLWTPITVLIVLQPTKGMTYHLGLQRLFGTILGSILALLLVYLMPPIPSLVVSVLTLIVAASAALANLGKLLNGYVFQSTGFTTAIVYLLSVAHQGSSFNYPLLRIGGIFIGILVTLLGLNFLKKESERGKLKEATKEVKLLTLEWVRKVLKEGVSDDSVRLRELIVKKTNILNDLSSYASSQRFFFGNSRSDTLHVMGTVYTIISLTRAQVRKLEESCEREHLTELSFPDIAQQFKLLEGKPARTEIHTELNWEGARKAFLRVILGGAIAGVAWLISGRQTAATFFMFTLVHTCVFSTNHRAVDRVKAIVQGLTVALFIIIAYSSSIGFGPVLTIPHLILLLLPGFLLSVFTDKAALGTVMMLFTLILYSITSGHVPAAGVLQIIADYAMLCGGVAFSLLLTLKVLPVQADRRYLFYRYRLFLETKRVTDLHKPLRPDWQMRMYSYIEGMLAYASDTKMDETQVMNEGLVAVDVCVEVLEIRSQIPSKEQWLKDKLMAAIPMITEPKLSMDERQMRLTGLSQEFLKIEPGIAYNLKVIAKKMKQNPKFFELKTS